MKPEKQQAPELAYNEILDRLGEANKSARECVEHLIALGYSQGQARNATYRYRVSHGLAHARVLDAACDMTKRSSGP